MVGLYREIRLLRRIFANAAKRRVAETDPTGLAIRKAIIAKWQNLAELETHLLESAGPVPETQRTAFMSLARTAENDADVRWLASALIRSPSASHWAPLGDAKDGIVRRLARGRAVE